jgi:hypothetical protein
MGVMDDEDKEMLRAIYECLLGDLSKEGFIGETKHKIEKLEGEIVRFKTYLGLVAVPLGAVIAEKIASVIM